MDKNRIEGQVDKAKGSVKDAAGKVLGNNRLRAEGEAGKVKGEIKKTVGEAADKTREGIDSASESFRHASKH
jgi:uncharacterized protein YjbJ (UPF0337 family)